jgi:hypothetical protein
VETIIGMEPHIRVTGIPQVIIFVIMPVGIIIQLIIRIPEHIIMQGVPFFIIMSMLMPSAGIIVHCMPFSVMAQVMGIIMAKASRASCSCSAS